MKFNNLIKITLCTVLTLFSSTIVAADTTLTCPTVDLITQAWDKMDNAIPDDHSYIVTSKPIIPDVDHVHLWSVRTIVPARNQEDAIKLAQITVKGTKALITPQAIKIFNQYGCIYFSARAYVYALTDNSL